MANAVGGKDRAGAFKAVGIAVYVGDHAACLGYKEVACRTVPRRDLVFKEKLHTSAGNVGKIKRGRSATAQIGAGEKQLVACRKGLFGKGVLLVGGCAKGNQRGGEGTIRNVNGVAVEIGSLALDRMEQLDRKSVV